MILSPAVLLPQTIRIEPKIQPVIEWPQPGMNINELDRFDEIFGKKDSPKKSIPPISPTSLEDDDWSEFVSNTETVPVQKPTSSLEDEWSDFVSSVPQQPQFNSGSWQNANFYNNPLSVYTSHHSYYVPKENNNNNVTTMGQNVNTPTNAQQQTKCLATSQGNINKNQFLN